MESDPVQEQLEAYNRRDIDAFLACYADDSVIRHGDGRVLMRGHEAVRARYEWLFARNPHLHAEVTTRLRAGEWVVDEEHVKLEDDELHVLVAYRVRSGLIDHVVMLRSDMQ